jgi:hypothetical protein
MCTLLVLYVLLFWSKKHMLQYIEVMYALLGLYVRALGSEESKAMES